MCSFLHKCHPKGGTDSRRMQVGVGVELSNVLGKVPPVPSIHVIQTACNLLSTRLPWNTVRSSPVPTASSKLPWKPRPLCEKHHDPKAYQFCSVTWLWSFVYLPPLPFTFQTTPPNTHLYKHVSLSFIFQLWYYHNLDSRFLIRTWQKRVSVKPRPL